MLLVSRAYCVLFCFLLCTWKAIWCKCDKDIHLLPDNSSLTASGKSIQRYCESTDTAWIELRIEEAVDLAVAPLYRGTGTHPHLPSCTSCIVLICSLVQWGVYCSLMWKMHISHAKHIMLAHKPCGCFINEFTALPACLCVKQLSLELSFIWPLSLMKNLM